MAFLGGERLLEAYRAAQADGYAFMANNIAEPNILIGLLEAYVDRRSDLVVQAQPSLRGAGTSGSGFVSCRRWSVSSAAARQSVCS
jgi:fructose/tagatose bisphosphate aldolase